MQHELPNTDLSLLYEYSAKALTLIDGQNVYISIAPGFAYSDATLEFYDEDDQPLDFIPETKSQDEILAHVEEIAQAYAYPISYRASTNHVVISRVFPSSEATDEMCLLDFTSSSTVVVTGMQGLGFRRACAHELLRNMQAANGPKGSLRMQAVIEGVVHEMKHQATLSAAELDNYEDFESILDEVEDLIEAVVDVHHNEDRSVQTATLSVLSRDPETGHSLRSIYASCLMPETPAAGRH